MLGPVRIPHMTCAPTVLDAINFFEAEIVHDPFVPTPGRARPEERRTGVELRSWGGYEKRRREREGEFCARVFCQDETVPTFSNLTILCPHAGRMAHECGYGSAPFSHRTLGEPTVDPGAQNSHSLTEDTHLELLGVGFHPVVGIAPVGGALGGAWRPRRGAPRRPDNGASHGDEKFRFCDDDHATSRFIPIFQKNQPLWPANSQA